MKLSKKIFGLVLVIAMGIGSVFAEENNNGEDVLNKLFALMSVPGEDSDKVIYSTTFENGKVEFAHAKLGSGGFYSVTITENTKGVVEKFTHTTFYNSDETEFKARQFEAKLYGQLIELGILIDVSGLCYALSDQYPPDVEQNSATAEGVPIHIRVATQTVTYKDNYSY